VLTYTKYAKYLGNKANLLEAQTVLEKALSIQPYNSELQKQLKALENRVEADRQYAAGVEALKESDQEKAIDSFSQALKLKADHTLAKKQIVLLKTKFADSYHKKAMILYRKQQLDEAIKTWSRVLMLDPEHEMAKLYRARAIELKEKIERL
jgi:tetratricopeptide (TPR) repeat protein